MGFGCVRPLLGWKKQVEPLQRLRFTASPLSKFVLPLWKRIWTSSQMISVENHQEICKNPFLNSAGLYPTATGSICRWRRRSILPRIWIHLSPDHWQAARPTSSTSSAPSPASHCTVSQQIPPVSLSPHNLRPVKVASVCHFPPSSVLRKAEFYIYILRCVSPVKSLGNTVTNYQALHSRATHVDWKIDAMYDFCFAD